VIAEALSAPAMKAVAKGALAGVEGAAAAIMVVDARAVDEVTALIDLAVSCRNRNTPHRAHTRITRPGPRLVRAPFKPSFPENLSRNTRNGLLLLRF